MGPALILNFLCSFMFPNKKRSGHGASWTFRWASQVVNGTVSLQPLSDADILDSGTSLTYIQHTHADRS